MKITSFIKGFALILPCLAVGYAGDAYASAYDPSFRCEETYFNAGASDNFDRDQFMYVDSTARGSRKAYYCGPDGNTGCNHNYLLLMPAGHHWQKVTKSSAALYRCDRNNGRSWEVADLSAIAECTESQVSTLTHTMAYGGKHYYCGSAWSYAGNSNGGVCAKAADSSLCSISEEHYQCIHSSNATWRAARNECECNDAGYKWQTNKCVVDTGTVEGECVSAGGRPIANGCDCGAGKYYDYTVTPKQCKRIEDCPSGSELCNNGTIIVLDDIGNIRNSGNSQVNTAQQNQQVGLQDQTASNTSSNSNSNENHNGSHNGNTTVVGDNNNVNVGGGRSSNNSLQNCLSSRTTANGRACCYLPSSGSNGAKYNASTDTCTCNAGNKTFSIDGNGHGKCIGGGNNVGPGPNPTVQCPNNMYLAADGTCKCSAENQIEVNNNTACRCNVPDATNDANGNCKCNDANKTIVDGQCVYSNTQCPNGMTFNFQTGQCDCSGQYQQKVGNTCQCTVPNAQNDASGVCKCNNKEMVVVNGKCEYDESAREKIRGEITATFTSLNSKMGGFEKSVWKDAEGNFNTARLASDSIAGVVLGTAGGIITAKVVKKNQLKKGFEDIKCQIGGQSVANYGDSFSVGM